MTPNYSLERSPTRQLLVEQIRLAEIDVEAMRMHVASLEAESRPEVVALEIELVRNIHRQYQNLLAALKVAAQTVR
jgi:hypothetical protein